MNKKLHFKSLLLLCALIVGSTSVWANEVSISISDYATSNNWQNSQAYPTVSINSVVSATGLDNGNNSKYYSSNNSWRHYEADGGTVTIATTSGKLNSVTITYTAGNSGVLKYNDSNVASGDICSEVDGKTSVTFTVGHSSGTKNGNVQITNIKVVYTSDGSDAPTCEAPTFSIESGSYTSAQSIEISTTTEGAKIYYTLDGTDPTDSSTEYQGAIEVSDDATIKAIAYLGSVKSSISEITITIAAGATFILNDKDAIEALGIELPEAGQGTKVESIEKDGIFIAATTAEGKTDTRIFQGSGNNKGNYDFRIYVGGTLTFTAGSYYIKSIVFTGKDLGYLQGNNYGASKWTGSAKSVTLTATGTATIYTITVTYGNPPAVEAPVSTVQSGTYYESQSVKLTSATEGAKIYYTTDGSDPTTKSTEYTKPIDVTETTTIKAIAATSDAVSTVTTIAIKLLLPFEITLTKDMETYCSAIPVDFSESGLTVYTAKVADGVAVLTEVESGQVPATRGVILKGAAGTAYTVKPIESAPSLSNNELYGITSDGKVSYEFDKYFCYIFQDGVFKKATEAKLKGGKAYLRTTYDITAAGARELKVVFEGEATGIKAVETVADQNVYDLQGRKVAVAQKGLYIVNGKKMFVK